MINNNCTPEPRSSGFFLTHVWMTIVIGIATVGPAGCTTPGYTVTSRCYNADKVERVFVIINVEISLKSVFAHSFEHSMISALQMNGVEARVVTVTSLELDAVANHEKEAENFAPGAMMCITARPLYRTRVDGYPAIVGINFEASLIDPASKNRMWQATGKVDYIKRFDSDYKAHLGIRKEFAWHTTAAIVSKFISEVNGQKPVPIDTVTEARQRHGQRID